MFAFEINGLKLFLIHENMAGHIRHDGFNLNVAILPGGLEDIVDHLIPVLQKAGRFRTEYTGQTLREHLGLKPYVARSGQSATRAA
ncbi:hypothetical protein AGMMS49960_22230 [Betaproteobacteria bacterium]|nr:hypothetical protein AGMMS49960_22230 [Betaproteobacteria bacterium]